MKSAEYQGDIGPDGNLYPFKVAVRDGVNAEAVAMLSQTPHMEVTDPNDPTAQGALIRSKTKFKTPEEFAVFPHMMYVARVGVGVDNVNMKLASENGVATVNTPGASTAAVAQRVVALMHGWASRIVQGTQALRSHEWPKGDKNVEPIDLSEKTLGIIGYGRIGQEVRRRVEGAVGNVVFTDTNTDIEGRIALDALLAHSDIISLNVAGNDTILTEEKLRLLKPGALIINTARGGVIDHAALLRKMDEGASAALDVFPTEKQEMFEDPIISGIVGHPNFLGTPHTAASDPVTQKKLAKEAAARMREFAREGIINPLNIPGHSLPNVSMDGTEDGGIVPGIRGVFLHRSVPGALNAVTDCIAKRDINIHDLLNREGPDGLAATVVHLDERDPQAALAILQCINERLRPLRTRLLLYV